MPNTADRTSPAQRVKGKNEGAVGKVIDPKEAQSKMMAEQPKNRPQTRSNKAADARDMGSRGK